MREAPAVPLIKGLLAAGASVQAYDPEAMKVARGIFGAKVHFADNSYEALTGADALAIVTEWNEFREPDFTRMRKLMRTPVIFDGRNIYNPEQTAGARLHLLLDGPAMSAVLVTGGAGYIGSHAVKALRARGESVVVFDNLQPATGRRPAHAHDGRRGRHPGHRGARGDDQRPTASTPSCTSRRGSRSATRSGTRPATTATTSAGRWRCSRRWSPTGVRHFVFSSTVRGLRQRRTDADPRGPAEASDQRLRRDEAGDRARAAALRDGLRPAQRSPCATSTPPAPIRTASSARITRPRFTSSRARSTRPWAAASFRIFGDDYPTPDGTCLRDYVHVTDLASAHLLALDALRAGAPSNAYNLGNGRPTSVRDVLAAVERVTGTPVPHELAPRRAGDPAACSPRASGSKRDLGWRPRFEELDIIVETAWRWRAAHPRGYATVTA